MRILSILAVAAISACAAADVQPPQTVEAGQPTGVWSYASHVDDLRAASCPEDRSYARAISMDLRVIEAERGNEQARENQLTGLTLAGAWQLKSSEKDFGGLSGLSVMRSGSLLAINDAGAFVWIGVDPETGHPDGIGAISYMRDARGNFFANKRDGDSEGLDYRDGLAFVSFEQDHRISAFDLERCGSAARSAPVVSLAPVLDGTLLADNRGPEALSLSGDGLSVGYELRKAGGSPIGTVNTDGSLSDVETTEQPLLFLMTGMDVKGDLSARIFRAYDPIRGARVMLHVDRDGERIGDGVFKRPLPVDNFEGVAIGQSPSGATRIWLISDDNFSANQRTLLLALDLPQ
ncbi:MAG: esterase-like activity of phytase family protein [Henriciella sp.]|nr:esterase-like activity of phytase family protein [Henriciella sp.]MBO6694182.1 esterase-like activity of phytase family protein [Henriciella sp.]